LHLTRTIETADGFLSIGGIGPASADDNIPLSISVVVTRTLRYSPLADVDVLQECFILQSSSEYQMVCSVSSRSAVDSKISLIRMIFAKPFLFLTYMCLYRHIPF
jgi:hypothetical protein